MMADKKSSPAVEKLDSENRKGSTSSEKLSVAGDLASVKKEVKKLDDVKDSPGNKAVIAEAEGKTVGDENKPRTARTDTDSGKKEKVSKKDKKSKEVVEIEREYVVPLRRGFLNVPRYRRAKKAVRVLKEFMVRHMGVRDRDLGKVKVDINLNNEIWFRGIKKPMSKVKVRAKKVGGIVYVELAEVPDVVGFKIARETRAAEKVKARGDRKRVRAAEKVKARGDRKRVTGDGKDKGKEVADKDKDGVDDKVEEKEDVAAGAEKAARVAKAVSKDMKHTAQGKHAKKVMPVRKALKK